MDTSDRNMYALNYNSAVIRDTVFYIFAPVLAWGTDGICMFWAASDLEYLIFNTK